MDLAAHRVLNKVDIYRVFTSRRIIKMDLLNAMTDITKQIQDEHSQKSQRLHHGRVAAKDVNFLWEKLGELREGMHPSERGDKEKMTYGELKDLLHQPEIVDLIDNYMGFHGLVPADKSSADERSQEGPPSPGSGKDGKDKLSPAGSPKSDTEPPQHARTTTDLKRVFQHDIGKVTKSIHDRHLAEKKNAEARESELLERERQALESKRDQALADF